MFLVNSRHPLVCAPRPWLPKDGASFSRTYGGNLPSSFNVVLSSALVYSTSPPVLVSGTVMRWSSFLEQLRCQHNPISTDNLRHSSLTPGYGILTVFPSASDFSLALGADSP